MFSDTSQFSKYITQPSIMNQESSNINVSGVFFQNSHTVNNQNVIMKPINQINNQYLNASLSYSQSFKSNGQQFDIKSSTNINNGKIYQTLKQQYKKSNNVSHIQQNSFINKNYFYDQRLNNNISNFSNISQLNKSNDQIVQTFNSASPKRLHKKTKYSALSNFELQQEQQIEKIDINGNSCRKYRKNNRSKLKQPQLSNQSQNNENSSKIKLIQENKSNQNNLIKMTNNQFMSMIQKQKKIFQSTPEESLQLNHNNNIDIFNKILQQQSFTFNIGLQGNNRTMANNNQIFEIPHQIQNNIINEKINFEVLNINDINRPNINNFHISNNINQIVDNLPINNQLNQPHLNNFVDSNIANPAMIQEISSNPFPNTHPNPNQSNQSNKYQYNQTNQYLQYNQNSYNQYDQSNQPNIYNQSNQYNKYNQCNQNIYSNFTFPSDQYNNYYTNNLNFNIQYQFDNQININHSNKGNQWHQINQRVSVPKNDQYRIKNHSSCQYVTGLGLNATSCKSYSGQQVNNYDAFGHLVRASYLYPELVEDAINQSLKMKKQNSFYNLFKQCSKYKLYINQLNFENLEYINQQNFSYRFQQKTRRNTNRKYYHEQKTVNPLDQLPRHPIKYQQSFDFTQQLINIPKKRILVDFNKLPICNKFVLKPSLIHLGRFTQDELSSVKNLQISNQYGSIQFLTPINLININIDKMVSIQRNSIKIQNESLLSVEKITCILTYKDFGYFSKLIKNIINNQKKQQKKKQFLQKINKWIKKCNLTFIKFDQETSTLKVKVN